MMVGEGADGCVHMVSSEDICTIAATFLNVKSITEVCPIKSSLVGTLGSLHITSPLPLIHSRVSLVLGHAVLTLLSQSGCLIFQSPVIIVGFVWSIVTLASLSMFHSPCCCSPSSFCF